MIQKENMSFVNVDKHKGYGQESKAKINQLLTM